MRFQSTLRRTERPISAALSPIPVNFNPRSDERSDDHRQASNLHIHRISIHAPTNGATLRICPRTLYIQISIHAPTNGATIVLHALLSVPPFQSTLRRTERPLCFLNLLVQILFQSTLRRTERPIVSGYAKKLGIFQSTLRRTERPILIKFVVFP